MIGVECRRRERRLIQELFQLFKVPWEFFDAGADYDVVLTTSGSVVAEGPAVVLVFADAETQADGVLGVRLRPASAQQAQVHRDSTRLPVYGNLSWVSREGGSETLVGGASTDEAAVIRWTRSDGTVFVRAGYDLVAEVEYLLTEGQPIANALLPTLDLHVALLREVIVAAGVPMPEVLPRPWGHELVTCLTHDVDFVGIRDHRFDRTFRGFLYRATVHTLLDFLRRRASLRKLLQNWGAALRSPLVVLGFGNDFWNQFDRYQEIEAETRATFFLIPREGVPGEGLGGRVDPARAANYRLESIHEELAGLTRAGFEVGLHGIDAWCDGEAARRERTRVEQVTGEGVRGHRTHWLWLDDSSFRLLEEAGFHYDSSFGYNEALGFRAGTSQVYRPPGARELLQLPLHIQDTTLFYPRRMHLRDRQALSLCEQVIDSVHRQGGVLTVLWHMRSLGPERLWEDFYLDLIDSLRARNAWFAPANEVVRWFRQRRQLRFELVDIGARGVRVQLSGLERAVEPQFALHVHNAPSDDPDSSWSTGVEVPIPDDGIVEIHATGAANEPHS